MEEGDKCHVIQKSEKQYRDPFLRGTVPHVITKGWIKVEYVKMPKMVIGKETRQRLHRRRWQGRKASFTQSTKRTVSSVGRVREWRKMQRTHTILEKCWGGAGSYCNLLLNLQKSSRCWEGSKGSASTAPISFCD